MHHILRNYWSNSARFLHEIIDKFSLERILSLMYLSKEYVFESLGPIRKLSLINLCRVRIHCPKCTPERFGNCTLKSSSVFSCTDLVLLKPVIVSVIHSPLHPRTADETRGVSAILRYLCWLILLVEAMTDMNCCFICWCPKLVSLVIKKRR